MSISKFCRSSTLKKIEQFWLLKLLTIEVKGLLASIAGIAQKRDRPVYPFLYLAGTGSDHINRNKSCYKVRGPKPEEEEKTIDLTSAFLAF